MMLKQLSLQKDEIRRKPEKRPQYSGATAIGRQSSGHGPRTSLPGKSFAKTAICFYSSVRWM